MVIHRLDKLPKRVCFDGHDSEEKYMALSIAKRVINRVVRATTRT